MSKLITVSLFLFVLCVNIEAQKKYINQFYDHQLYLINPAAAGTNKMGHNLYGYYQKQWFGVEHAPASMIIAYDGPVSRSIGLGSFVYHDRNGSVEEFGLQQSFAYEVTITDTRRHYSTLGFGLSVSMNYVQFHLNTFEAASLDPVVMNGNLQGFGLNANFGILYKMNNFYAGGSVTNLLPQNNKVYKSSYEPRLSKNMFAIIGYSHQLEDRLIYFDENIMVNMIDSKNRYLNAVVKATMYSSESDWGAWLHCKYAHSIDESFGKGQSIYLTPGILHKNITAGLRFQLYLTGAHRDFGGAMQLMFGYKFVTNKKHKRIPCILDKKNKRHRKYKYVSY